MADVAQRIKYGVHNQSRRGNFILVAASDQVVIYALPDKDGESQGVAAAQYRVPAWIGAITCMGECVCVGLQDGQVRSCYQVMPSMMIHCFK